MNLYFYMIKRENSTTNLFTSFRSGEKPIAVRCLEYHYMDDATIHIAEGIKTEQ